MKSIIDSVKKIIPPLSYSLYKGQAGRVTLVGGCSLYTGAPYYAGISALKAGCDLSFVICSEEAAVMKSYSPELMIYPIMEEGIQKKSTDVFIEKVEGILGRSHSIVVGPGLGRDDLMMKSTKLIIEGAKKRNLNIVVDGDGMFLVTKFPEIISGYEKTILTPNAPEYSRLASKVFGKKGTNLSETDELEELCKELGFVTIVKKGKNDIVSNGSLTYVLDVDEVFEDFDFIANPRRCGGIGDVLSGSIGTFATWSDISTKNKVFPMKKKVDESALTQSNFCLGAIGGCLLTKMAASIAFKKHKRGMTTPNIIQELPNAFEVLFPEASDPCE